MPISTSVKTESRRERFITIDSGKGIVVILTGRRMVEQKAIRFVREATGQKPVPIRLKDWNESLQFIFRKNTRFFVIKGDVPENILQALKTSGQQFGFVSPEEKGDKWKVEIFNNSRRFVAA